MKDDDVKLKRKTKIRQGHYREIQLENKEQSYGAKNTWKYN